MKTILSTKEDNSEIPSNVNELIRKEKTEEAFAAIDPTIGEIATPSNSKKTKKIEEGELVDQTAGLDSKTSKNFSYAELEAMHQKWVSMQYSNEFRKYLFTLSSSRFLQTLSMYYKLILKIPKLI